MRIQTIIFFLSTTLSAMHPPQQRLMLYIKKGQEGQKIPQVFFIQEPRVEVVQFRCTQLFCNQQITSLDHYIQHMQNMHRIIADQNSALFAYLVAVGRK